MGCERFERLRISSDRADGHFSAEKTWISYERQGGLILRNARENMFGRMTGSSRVSDGTAQGGETLGRILVFEP